ncbi:MAG: hydrogenase formation protein HypD [Anaerovoracaceae bacterium]
MEISKVIEYLKAYNGPEIKLMEVCGTHTASIFNNGIRSLISPKIKLISGPGCPVCVTPTAYIDKCIEYACKENHILLTFGDMMKVPGTHGSLSQSKGRGAKVELMYSPFEAVEKAKANPNITYVVAAVGFETTAPAYPLMIKDAKKQGVKNLRLVTALKTLIPALTWICENQQDIDGFICPGHISVIIGSEIFKPLAEKYHKPFVVAGFEGEHILAVIYDLLCQIQSGKAEVKNLYKSAVKDGGNKKALDVIDKAFVQGPAMWRGLGIIPDSGLYLADAAYDVGSKGLDEDMELPEKCCCASVIVGKMTPDQCPMFAKGCTPTNPFGPCMVSSEGACGIWFKNQSQVK